ncbi:tRNA pseudouridine(55) synthase TruB [Gloeocapsopsis dulcis]|uniref:tRNA pseudouridine synthase B n=1 Tax=Gloeocapsopsis dulcis AAB1 = 1H9 TaxID=1433147 RepID=A0A6N8FW90_9CHRO|nr:tRNA pseudouridine(55) synthase TruB [Gloeocapsopsis dulcis]MUL37333.1 tRNA pseudouridine(55) synthase TruB [Gloeocapsopsis dulcis AAB1 = 1H9]WNN88957.1 tRNA pseudouridine(55) synthase TruB [Gloeocapsopsis dulcis]
MLGFLNLNKPAGFTSHDCVARVRRLLQMKRIGHGGTLDPAATGVLPIALGKATRLLQFLQSQKAYKATIQLGITTTTDDLEGDIITSQPVSYLSLEQVTTALQQFQGKFEQIPPRYSAIQVQGKRLYDLARAGENVEIPVRSVEVFQIDILDWRPGDFPQIEVAIACGAGTYIRAIARDLGRVLQTGGTLAKLIRTQSSGFHLADSLTLEQLASQVEQDNFQPIPPPQALQHLGSITLPAEIAQKWCQGQKVPYNTTEGLSLNSPLQVYQEGEYFLGIGYLIAIDTETKLIPQIVF